MTKKELHEAITGLLAGKVDEETLAQVDELLKPKVGGGKANPEDYTVFDAEGNPVYIFCNVHKKWEPVADEEGNLLFKEDPKSKNGYRRYCIEGDKQWNDRAKAYRATKEAITQDLINEEITAAETRELLAQAEADRKAPLEREDGIGFDERPEL